MNEHPTPYQHPQLDPRKCEKAPRDYLAKIHILPRVPLIGSKQVLRDRRGDEMTVICALHPWVEAQDRPCKGSEEIQKSATVSLLTEF